MIIRDILQKLSFKITLCVLLIGIAISSLFLYKNYTIRKNDSLGTITITLEAIDNNILSTKEFNFSEDDTLFEILINNYQVRYEDTMYGKLIYDIDDLKTDFSNTYIAIYVDNTYSNVGISSIPLYDKENILFKEEAIW